MSVGKCGWDPKPFHSGSQCWPGPCPFHAPSGHKMRSWRKKMLKESGLVVRRCPHGGLHPDPDSEDWYVKWASRPAETADALSLHDCDGCCK